MSQVKSPFGASATALVLWEGAAIVTEDLQRHGLIIWRVPFVSELLRKRPRIVRAGCAVGAGLVLWEHLEYTPLTRAVIALVSQRVRSPLVGRKRSLSAQQIR